MSGLAAAALLLATMASDTMPHARHARDVCTPCVTPATFEAAGASADAWLGSDKFVHAGMSWAVAAFAYAGLRLAGADGDAGLTIALPVAAAAGVGKELHDRRRGGRFSVRDLVADAVGIGAAYFLLREVR